MATGKTALITGVSRETGLGFETARQLTALAFTMIITGRDFVAVSNLASSIQATPMAVDITSDESVAHLFTEYSRRFDKLDVLINNAGAYFDYGAEPLSAEMNFVKEAFDTKLLGAWRMVKAFLPLLQKSTSARIVNVSSGAGSFSDPVFGLSNHFGNVPVYSLTKLALNGLTMKLARQLKDTGIKVNAICPGFVATYPGTAEMGARPVNEGAKSITWAVTIPDNGPSGGFFRDGKAIDW